MEKTTKKTREAHLLAVRTKELGAMRERLAATEEVLQLQNAWLVTLLRAALGKMPLAREGDTLLVPKKAVREAFDAETLLACDTGEYYSITLQKRESGEEATRE